MMHFAAKVENCKITPVILRQVTTRTLRKGTILSEHQDYVTLLRVYRVYDEVEDQLSSHVQCYSPKLLEEHMAKAGNDQKSTRSVLRVAVETFLTAEHGLALTRQEDPQTYHIGARIAIVFGRAVTNVLQNMRNIEPDFNLWYESHLAKLDETDIARHFYDLRSEILKQGTMGPLYKRAMFAETPDEIYEVLMLSRHQDYVPLLLPYLTYLRSMIEEAYKKFLGERSPLKSSLTSLV